MFTTRAVFAVVLLVFPMLGCGSQAQPVAQEPPVKRNADAPTTALPVAANPTERGEDITSRYHAVWKQKLTAANEAVAKNPKDAGAYTTRSSLYLDRVGYKLALADAEKALAIDANSAEALRIRAICHRRLNEPDKARDDFERAMKLQPDDGDIVASYATFQREQGAFLLAILKAFDAVKLSPKSARARNALGLVLKQKNDLELALSEFDEATKLDPDYPFPYLSRGQILMERGDFHSSFA